MKLKTLLVAALALPVLASSVYAQPSTAPTGNPPNNPPPGTKEKENVSTMNGQLVPVGDRNKYVYNVKKYNVSTNPLMWVFGSYSVGISYTLNDKIAVRGDIGMWAPVEDSASGDSGVEIGVAAPIYFRKMYSGLFVEPGIISRTIVSSSATNETNTIFGPQFLVGWHWIWDSGLNMSIAFGAGRNWSTNKSDDHYSSSSAYDDKIFPSGYWRFGYAF